MSDPVRSSAAALIPMTRLLWMDYGGVLHCKMVPTSMLRKNTRIMRCCLAFTITSGNPADSIEGSSSEVTLLPTDVATDRQVFHSLRHIPVPWHPNHTFMFGAMHDRQGVPFQQDCRLILQNAVDMLGALGESVTAGFELEFALLKPSADGSPAKLYTAEGDCKIFASVMDVDFASEFLDDVVATLDTMGIVVCLTHSEGGKGQYEIVLQEREVRRAVEDVTIARESIRLIARRHGLQATFSPMWGCGLGNGGHVHLSLDGHFGRPELLEGGALHDAHRYAEGVDDIGCHFMAGICEALPWLMFAVNNRVTSYDRVRPGFWTGAHCAWGVNDREMPMRLVDDCSNFEIKVGDGISNPFLAVAAILTAGAVGIRKKTPLPPPCVKDPIKEGFARLPTSLDAAMVEFQRACKDDMVASIFPDDVQQNWTVVCKEEIKYVKEKGIDSLRDLIMQVF